MLGSHVIYQKTRKESRAKIEDEKAPFWLRAFSKITKNQQASPIFQDLISTLKPWEGDASLSRIDADSYDKRWTIHRNNFRNLFAMSIRKHITKTYWFDTIITICTLGVGVITGWSLDNPDSSDGVSSIFDMIAVSIFTIEALLKILAEGEQPQVYFLDPEDGTFNFFDFMIVVLSWAFFGQATQTAIQCMRLLRLLRFFTVVKNIAQLRVIVIGLIQGLKSSVYIVMLLLMVIYMCSIAAVDLFGENDPGHFGNITVALVTLFQISTETSWTGIVYTAMYGCDVYGNGFYNTPNNTTKLTYKSTMMGTFPLWDCVKPRSTSMATEFFFIAFIIITAMVIMSLFIGAITMAMFVAFTNIEMSEMYDEYEEAISKTKVELSPFRDIGRKLNTIFSDAFVGKSVGAWNGQYDRRAFILLCFNVSESNLFQHLVTLTIIVIAFVIAYESDYNDDSVWLYLIAWAAIIVFTIEAVVKMGAQAITPGTSASKAIKKYFVDHWNKFDFFVLCVGLLDLFQFSKGPWVVLRLLRLLRLFRLAKSFPRLRSIIEALATGLSSALWVCILIFIINYMLACLGMILFQKNDPFHFGSLGQAFFSIWRVETLDSWDVILRINMYGCATYPNGYPFYNSIYKCREEDEVAFGYIAMFFFVFTVILGGLILPTVLIGIVAISFENGWKRYTSEMIMNAILELLIENIQREMPEWWSQDRLWLIKTAFYYLDADGAGSLDIMELEHTLSYVIKVYITAVPYDWPLSAREEAVVREHVRNLFMVMDSSGDALINVVEFVGFIISAKQVQIKMRQSGIIDNRALKEAVTHDYKRQFRINQETDDGKPFVHPNIGILVGCVMGDSGIVEDLSVVITRMAKQLKMDELALERWVALQVSNFTSDMFLTLDQEEVKDEKNAHLTHTFRAERKKLSQGKSSSLSKFMLSVHASGSRKVNVETQTPKIVKADDMAADADLLAQHHSLGLGDKVSEAPLFRQGYDKAIKRQKASLFAHNKNINGNNSVLRPFPRLLFAENGVTVPAPDVIATSVSNRMSSLAIDHVSQNEIMTQTEPLLRKEVTTAVDDEES